MSAIYERDSAEFICLLPWIVNIPTPIGNGGGSMSFPRHVDLSILGAVSSAITAIPQSCSKQPQTSARQTKQLRHLSRLDVWEDARYKWEKSWGKKYAGLILAD